MSTVDRMITDHRSGHRTDQRTDQRTDPAVLAVAAMSAAALALSALSLVLQLDDDREEQRVHDRLACLERPGPNDCGLDGR